MSQTTCWACQAPCHNWGIGYRNFCPSCAVGLHKLIDGCTVRVEDLPTGNGWGPSCDVYINRWIASLNQQTSAIIADNSPKEYPCHNCQKLNEVGVKVCLWCEVDDPITHTTVKEPK